MTTYSSDSLIKYFSRASKVICVTFFICYHFLVYDNMLHIMNIEVPYPYFAGFIGGTLVTTWAVTLLLQVLNI